jgi:alpha-acetolactate decarboxylase
MTVKELISKKDYDYINWRMTLPEDAGGGDMFIGLTKSKNGRLIPLDGDNYNENTEVKHFEEWSSENIKSGLTIVI